MHNRNRNENDISDIYDGQLYKKFMATLNNEELHSFATCVFNSDGSPVFKSSTHSIWPIQISLNEIPAHVRQKKTITWALWFGKSKPDMNTFFKTFTDIFQEMSKNGVSCVVNNIKKNIKLYALCCCVDSVARTPMQGLTQFNGRYGCNWCLHPGKATKNKNTSKKNSSTLKYVLLEEQIEMRTIENMHQFAEIADTNKPCMGVKHPTILSELPCFNIVDGFVPDSMHCLFLGVCRQFARYWFNHPGEDYYLGKKKMKTIETILESIKAPNAVCRLNRSLKDRKYWKYREWENWLLYYSLPVLRSMPEFEKYADHWSLLVQASYILMQQKISKDQLIEANKYLENFVILTQIYYSSRAMSFNVHQLLHLAQSVYNWGPLWAHHGYPFENGNGEISRTAQSAKGVLFQICRSLNFKRCISIMEWHLKQHQPERLKFCESLDQKYTSKYFQVSPESRCKYYGRPKKTDAKWSHELDLLPQTTVSYQRIAKNSCLYSTKKNLRSNNSYAKLDNDTFVKIKEFVTDPITCKEYTSFHQLITCSDGFNHEIVSEDEICSAILTKSIIAVAVCIQIKQKKYVTCVPNMVHC
ncbi:hypothetical protein TKK_0017583 [Trichogramma kaykai]